MLARVRRVYLKPNFHFPPACATTHYIFKTLRSKFFYYNLLKLPYLFFHSFTMSKTTLVYPFVCRFLCLPTPRHSTPQKTFYPSGSHYTSTIPSCHFSSALPSPLLSLSSAIKNNTPDTCLENVTFCTQ